MFDPHLWEKAKCLPADKKKLLPLVDKFTAYAEKARREGLLSLESPRMNEPPLIRFGLGLVIDGHDSDNIRDIMLNSIYSGSYDGHALLERMMILQGLLLIYQESQPIIMKRTLLSMLGEDFLTKEETPSVRKPLDYRIPVVNEPYSIPETLTVEDEKGLTELIQLYEKDAFLKPDSRINPDGLALLDRYLTENEQPFKKLALFFLRFPPAQLNTLLENLAVDRPSLYHELRKNMVYFSDLKKLDNRSIQKILRQTEISDLIKALIGTDPGVQIKLLSNLPPAIAQQVAQGLDQIKQITRDEVLDSQNRILNVSLKLSDEGELILPPPTTELLSDAEIDSLFER